MTADTIRIANCSGYYGDRLDAAREMVEGGPIDVLTGDYLAELTMGILYGQKQARGEQMGYVGTFLKQLEEVARSCAEKNIKIVVNAGGLNPKAMADETQKILDKLGVKSKVAWIDGDDLTDRIADLAAQGETLTNIDTGAPLTPDTEVVTANAYFGGWGIKEALDQGADIVICPRVTDAAVVIGPAAWKFGWSRNDYDALAGALTAGHIIECGAQCCGGNYSFFQEVPSFHNMGYPIAEIERDGSFTISKHPGTGGLISVGTITAQLLYEISTPAYMNPDVVAHFDTIKLEQVGPDRVRVSGVRGSSPPTTHKVCINTLGPHKQSLDVLLTGLDIEKKAEVFLDQIFHNMGGREQFDSIETELIRSDNDNPASNELAYANLRVVVTSKDPKKLGRIFQAKVTELGLASIPGNTTAAAGSRFDGGRAIVHWPALVDSKKIVERVHIGDAVTEVPSTQSLNLEEMHYQRPPADIAPSPGGESARIHFGRLFGTRSGDKGGAGNVGVWANSDEAYGFLHRYLTVEEFKRLCPDMAGFPVERYEMPNMRALNFYVKGLLGGGAAANNRIDRQAKTLGEYLGAKVIELPRSLISRA